MNLDWISIEYLKDGNERQKQAYSVLHEIKIFDILKPYNPILTGTIPIQIDLPDSDLDIICEAHDLEGFRQVVDQYFSDYKDFNFYMRVDNYTANMLFNGFKIEIFAQPIPTCEQLAYRHMQIEYRLLNLLGENFRKKIIRLKQEGLKTEPAFGKLLGFRENPYEELLLLESYSNEDLLAFALKINKFSVHSHGSNITKER